MSESPPVSQPTCANCRTELAGPYCHACGQKDVDLRRGLLAILSEGLRETFEFDGRIPRSMFTLLFRPGELASRWYAGERARFSSPVRMYLFATVLSLFVVNCAADRTVTSAATAGLVGYQEDDDGGFGITMGDHGSAGTPDLVLHVGPEGSGDDALDVALRDLLQDRPPEVVVRDLIGTALSRIPTVLVGMMVLTTLLLQVLGWRERLVRHALFSITLHTVGLYAFALAMIVPVVGTPLALLLVGTHLVLGVHRAYAKRWRWTIPVALTLGITWVVVFGILELLAVGHHYWSVGQALIEARERAG